MAPALRATAPAPSIDPAHPLPPNRIGPLRRTRTIGLALAVGAAVAVVPGVAGSASAMPASPVPQAPRIGGAHPAKTPTEKAVARLRALQKQADLLVEQYDSAKVALAAAGRRAAALDRSLAASQQRTDGLQSALGNLVAAAYRSGDNGVGGIATTILGGDDPAQVLDGASSLDALAHDQQARLGQYERARQLLADSQAAAATQLAIRTRIETDLARRRTQIERSLLGQQQLLSRLGAAGRRTLAAPSAGSVPLSSIVATGKAAAAIRFAYAQLGKPYQWGAAGPGSYDCSGLTMRAWGAAGVSLPHSASGQYAAGRHVATDALQPGDLVFFGQPIHHVGLYIGGGNMIAAPHTGDVVKIQPLTMGDSAGAVRPG